MILLFHQCILIFAVFIRVTGLGLIQESLFSYQIFRNHSYHSQAVGQVDGYWGRGKTQGEMVEHAAFEQDELIWPETVDWGLHVPHVLPGL